MDIGIGAAIGMDIGIGAGIDIGIGAGIDIGIADVIGIAVAIDGATKLPMPPVRPPMPNPP